MGDPKPPEDPDRDIVHRAQRGDQTSLDQLLVRYLPRLRAFLRLRLDAGMRARESCSDLVQTVCREVLENAERYEWQGEERFRAWLFKTALNKVRDRARFWKAEMRDPALEVPGQSELQARSKDASPSQFAIANELDADMEAAFDLLTEEHREVITLSRVLALPHSQIAREMGRSEGAVRMLLSRALLAYVAAVDRVRGER